MADLNINSRAQTTLPNQGAAQVPAKVPKTSIAGDTVSIKSAAKPTDPFKTPKRSIWYRIGAGLLWGCTGAAIGGGVAMGGLAVLSLMGASTGFIGGLIAFAGLGVVGGAIGTVIGLTHKKSKGDFLSDPQALKSDPNGMKIQDLVKQAGSKKGHDALGLYDQATKLATTAEAAAFIAKNVSGNNPPLDATPYYAQAVGLSKDLTTTLRIASALNDTQYNWGSPALTAALDAAYTKASMEATPAQALSIAEDATKQGSFKGAKALTAKGAPSMETCGDALSYVANLANHIPKGTKPDVNPAYPIMERALSIAATSKDAMDVQYWAVDWPGDLSDRATAKAATLK